MRPTPSHLVLLGAGHAHVEVLRRTARCPIPGTSLTLVTREPHAAYSGMLPGLLRGDYAFDDAHIACAPLAAAAGARLLIVEAEGIDVAAGTLRLAGQPPLPFDLLSIDVGGRPAMPPGGGVPARPVGRLLAHLATLEARLIPGDRLAVIGAGAGGCELALALTHRLGPRTGVVLIGRDPVPLPGAPARAQAVVRRALAVSGIDWLGGVAAGPFRDGALALSDGRVLALAEAFWATGVAGPAFLAAAGLPCDAAGCLRVDATLRSIGDARVFAAGDCAALDGNQRPKAGVWAVRAGRILDANLRRAAAGRPPRRWCPQREALTILSLGDHRAVAWRNGFVLSGRLVWRWKDHIDRKWMRRYADFGR